MPFYDYRCDDCGSTFEVKRSMSEQEGSAAPECSCCGSDRTRRVFSTFFAGSGGASGGSGSGFT